MSSVPFGKMSHSYNTDPAPLPQNPAKMSQRELAKEKIRRMSAGERDGKGKKKVASILQQRKQKNRITTERKPKPKPARRESVPQDGTFKSCPTSSVLQGPPRRHSVGDVTPTSTSASGFSSSTSTSSKSQSKVLFINTPELPPCTKGPYPRKTSFLKRKRLDNQLGYRGRESHRHSWQKDRHEEYNNYVYGIPGGEERN